MRCLYQSTMALLPWNRRATPDVRLGSCICDRRAACNTACCPWCASPEYSTRRHAQLPLDLLFVLCTRHCALPRHAVLERLNDTLLKRGPIKDNDLNVLPLGTTQVPPFLRNTNKSTVGYAHGKSRTPYLVSTTRAVAPFVTDKPDARSARLMSPGPICQWLFDLSQPRRSSHRTSMGKPQPVEHTLAF